MLPRQLSALDDDLLPSTYRCIFRFSTQRVRGGVDWQTLDWKVFRQTDLEVVQTAYYTAMQTDATDLRIGPRL